MEEVYSDNDVSEIRLTKKDLARLLNGQIIKCFKISVGMVEE